MTEPKNSTAASGAGVVNTKLPVFEVASVEKTDAPKGEQGRNWYRYVLKSHCSTITGHRSGTRQFVHDYAVQCAEQLNTRAATSQSIWSPRGRKPAAATATS
jgi:hypothetical protein